MKILVHYAFTDGQVDELRTIATEYGHDLYYAADEAAAIEQVPGCECLLGLFNENVDTFWPLFEAVFRFKRVSQDSRSFLRSAS